MSALSETSAAVETTAAVIPSRRRGTPRHGAGTFTSQAGSLPECGPARLEPARIRLLAEDTENPTLALNFLRDFLSMLSGRVTRILDTLAACDATAAMDAALSLRTTSAMTGAVEAEWYCRRIESLVRRGDFGEASETAQRLRGIVMPLMAAGPELLLEARSDLAAEGGWFRAEPSGSA